PITAPPPFPYTTLFRSKSAPRLVLFSPIAHEKLHDRNLPDGSENNQRIELYATAMAEAARANHVPFVDLFKPTLELYATKSKPRSEEHTSELQSPDHLV